MPIILFSPLVKSVCAYLIALKVVSQIWFSQFFSKKLNLPFFTLYLIFSSSTFLYIYLNWPNNSTLIVPITQILAIFLYRFYINPKNLLIFLTCCLLLTFGIQVHFTIIFIWPFFFLIICQQTKMTKERLKLFAGFFLILLISLIPYTYAFVMNKYFDPLNTPIFIDSQFGLQHTLLRWQSLIQRAAVSKSYFSMYSWDAILLYAYTILRLPWILLKKGKKSFFDRLFLVSGAITIFLSPWIINGVGPRYYLAMYTIALFFFCYELFRICAMSIHIRRYTTLSVISVLLYMRFASYENSYSIQTTKKCLSCFSQVEAICDYFNKSEISFDDFIKNTYQVWQSENKSGLYFAKIAFKVKKVVPSKTVRNIFSSVKITWTLERV